MVDNIIIPERANQIKAAIKRNNDVFNIVIFDFDGTLRDGLQEKTFVFDLAGQITHRIIGRSDLYKPFTVDDMRHHAGRPVDVIGQDHWPATVEFDANFGKEYFTVRKDIYAYYNMALRNGPDVKLETEFTDKELALIAGGMPHAEWFPGVSGMVENLYDNGTFTSVLSNTPTIKALADEVNSGGFGYQFDIIHTGSPLKQGKPDGRAALHVMAHAVGGLICSGTTQTMREAFDHGDAEWHDKIMFEILAEIDTLKYQTRVLVVGDGLPDMEVAKNAVALMRKNNMGTKQLTVETMALTYGFATAATLRQAQPTYLVTAPEQLPEAMAEWTSNNTPEKPGAKPNRFALDDLRK